MREPPTPRRARPADAEAVLAIYAPLVERTAISFEELAPTPDEMAARIESALATHEWLVAEIDGELAGYAYATGHRARAAYRFSVEVSAYVHEAHRGRGVGAALYRALFEALGERGFRAAFAGIALPNEPSVALHRSAGFEPIGTFAEVGWKLGAWHDVSWWRRRL